MKKKNTILPHFQPAIIAIISFLFLLVATISYTNYKKGLWEKDIRSNLLDVLIGKKSKLEKALYSRIYYTRGVAAFVALKPNITTGEFQELASEYIKNDTVISTMALSRNCVINAIYPIKGHEAAIGLDLLKHPERKEIVEKTIETHQTFVAGPLELVEGGIAFISYTPIFDKQNKNANNFWGVTDIVIKQQSLFNEARFVSPENNFEFALRGYNGLGDKGAVFWGKAEIFNQNPVTINIELPIGTWVLAGIPSDGWNQYPNQDKTISFILFLSSLIISILIWLFTKALLKISQNEKELKAIFGSMDNLIVEYNSKGEYVKIAPTNNSILFKPKAELIGKTVYDIFDQEKADVFMKAIQDCLHIKELVVIEYLLQINGKECWFSARVSYKSDDSVIFNAFDITERKMNEEIIQQSELRMKMMNQMKDKFYSIIAHDLRNPVGSMKVLTDFLLEDYDTVNEDERKQLLEGMQQSSNNLYILLEDLLEWTRSQSGNIVVRRQLLNMKDLIFSQIDKLNAGALQKNIKLINEIDESVTVIADQDLTGIILRNLLSNAIKFTDSGGEIKIAAEAYTNNDKQFLKINVTDNGLGICTEKLEELFLIDKSVSTPGTENEQGTGLGLLLCKELTEKQGGEILVSSILGQGSTFSIILPLTD